MNINASAALQSFDVDLYLLSVGGPLSADKQTKKCIVFLCFNPHQWLPLVASTMQESHLPVGNFVQSAPRFHVQWISALATKATSSFNYSTAVGCSPVAAWLDHGPGHYRATLSHPGRWTTCTTATLALAWQHCQRVEARSRQTTCNHHWCQQSTVDVTSSSQEQFAHYLQPSLMPTINNHMVGGRIKRRWWWWSTQSLANTAAAANN